MNVERVKGEVTWKGGAVNGKWTYEQLDRLAELRERYERIVVYPEPFGSAMMCDCGDIVIGIERDGHAHS